MPSEALRVLLDGHVLDYLLDEGPEAVAVVLRACEAGEVVLYETHVLRDELDAMPPDKGERWAELEALRARLTWAPRLPTAGLILDTSRLDEATLIPWDDVPVMEGLIGTDLRNAEDALLAMTARRDSLILVTADRGATNRAHAAGVEVLTPRDFVRACHSRVARA